jgi:hypothetical protein
MQVNFSVVGGRRRAFALSPDIPVGSAKQLLSVSLDVPPERLTFVHSAAILEDHVSIGSLDFRQRNFISVTVDRNARPALIPRSTPDPLVRDLRPHFGDSQLSIREQVLQNPSLLNQIVTEFARNHPEGADYLAENPELLLDILDIQPAEFADAMNRAVQSESDLVSRFLAELTSDDFLALERVMTTNVPLNVAIPIFVRHGKDVDATIEQINRMYGNRDHH